MKENRKQKKAKGKNGWMDEQKGPSDEPAIRIDIPPGTPEICYECQMSALHLQSFSLSQFGGKMRRKNRFIQDVEGGKNSPDQPRLLTHLQQLRPFNAHKRPSDREAVG